MGVHTISRALRARREALGLSLQYVAGRADTSVATVSRYERGWDRFEVRTLRKLASALDCELQVALTPRQTIGPRPRQNRVARRIRRLFWDHALVPADLVRHPQWVLERVLELGDLEDVRLLLAFMGREVFLDRVAGARFSSPRTAAFWKQIIEREGRTCTKRSFRDTAWRS